MEQVVAQNKAELEQAGWEFQSEELPSIPTATVFETGNVIGDMLPVISAALQTNKPYQLFMVGAGGTKYLATGVGTLPGGDVRFYTYPKTRKQVTFTTDGVYLGWQNE